MGKHEKRIKAILPDIPNIKAHWDHPGSDPIPYLIVPMSDNSVIRYNPEIQHPAAGKTLENIRKLTDMRNGYFPKEQIERAFFGEEDEHGSDDRRDA